MSDTTVQDTLRCAMMAEAGDMLSVSPDTVRAMAEQCFFDGVRMAAAVSDDPIFQAKLWALTRSAPKQTPPI